MKSRRVAKGGSERRDAPAGADSPPGAARKGRRGVSAAPGTQAHAISATLAARRFSDLLNRVRYRGERFVIERGGEPICEMSSVKPARFTGAELRNLLRSLAKPGEGYWEAVEEASNLQRLVPRSPWER